MDANGRYTKDDIHGDCDIETDNGLIIRVRVLADEDAGFPWDRGDGHGPVSEWTRRAKEPGEMVLASDRGSRRYYDFAEAVRIARRDGWGVKGATAGERAHLAALEDYRRMRAFCNDQWSYVGVTVEAVREDTSATWASESLWGIESDGDYWREVAAELVNSCVFI